MSRARALEGRVALVTGASRGIGRAIAFAFARNGADVAVTARRAGPLEGLARELIDMGVDSLPIPADLEEKGSVERIVEATGSHFGKIDLLVNNAGVIHPPIDLIDFDSEDWRRVVEVNLIAPALLTKAVLQVMVPQRSGRILNISSKGGRQGGKGRSAYRATKAAMINLTESVAAEVKPYGIDVVCLCPGPTDTDGYLEAFGEEGRARFSVSILSPEQIADVAVFLMSESASAITGTAIDAMGDANPLFT